MTSTSRSWALVAGAAALLSSQAVYAAPVRAVPAGDPLVSLSLLGTAQSRAAVCAAGAACALPTATRAAATAASPAVAAAASTAAAQYPAGRPVGVDWKAVTWIFVVFLGFVLPIALTETNEPVSPA